MTILYISLAIVSLAALFVTINLLNRSFQDLKAHKRATLKAEPVVSTYPRFVTDIVGAEESGYVVEALKSIGQPAEAIKSVSRPSKK